MRLSKSITILAAAAAAVLLPSAVSIATPLDPTAYTSLGTLNVTTGSITFNTDTNSITGAATFTGVNFAQGGSFDPNVSVFDFANFTIASNVTVNITGSKPLAILSRGALSISSALTLNGGAGGSTGVAGVSVGGGFAGGTGGSTGAVGSGPGGGMYSNSPHDGGGGGFGGAGGAGNTSSIGGVANGDIFANLIGGSGGGGAVGGGGATGGGGGAGGGALELGAVGAITLNAAISANGGLGPAATAATGGAGSGGGILIHGSSVFASNLLANGGNGTGYGGAGGGGRIITSVGAVSSTSTGIIGTSAIGGAAGGSGNAKAGTGGLVVTQIGTLTMASSTQTFGIGTFIASGTSNSTGLTVGTVSLGVGTIITNSPYTWSGANHGVNLSGGTLAITNSSTFSNGSNLKYSSGNLAIASGKTLAIDGATGTFTAGTGLSNGATLLVRNGAQLNDSSYLDIGSSGTGGASAAMTVDGTGSTFTAGTTYTDIGFNSGDSGTVTFSNSSVGTYSTGLHLAGNGGQGVLNVTTGATLNVARVLSANQANTGTATININGGTLNSNGSSAFGSGSTVNLVSGSLNFGGNATFSTGSTLNLTSGNLSEAAGSTLAFSGGIGTFANGPVVSNGATIAVTNGGHLTVANGLDVANGPATGTLLVDGSGSSYQVPNATNSFYGAGPNESATVTFSNSAVGNITEVDLGTAGGSALLNVLSGATLNVGSIESCDQAAGNATININGGGLTVNGTSSFNKTTPVTVSNNGSLNFNGNATFSSGSSLNLSSGNLSDAAGTTLTFDGGNATLTGGHSVSNNSTLVIQDGSHFTTDTSFNVGDYSHNGTNGTLIVDGAGTTFSAGPADDSAIGFGFGDAGTVTYSNSAVGIYNRRLVLNYYGANATLNINSNASVTAGGLISNYEPDPYAGTSTIDINGGSLVSLGTATFAYHSMVNVTGNGYLGLGGNATFTTGSSLNLSSGSISDAAGTTLSFSGGNATITGSRAVSNGSTLVIQNGSQFTTDTTFNVGSGLAAQPNGKMIVSGSGTVFSAGGGGNGNSVIGYLTGDSGAVTYSNSAVGTYARGLLIAPVGGNGTLNVNSGASVTVGTLSVGSTGTISINGGTLSSLGDASFTGNASVNISGNGFLSLGGNATFSTGSKLSVTSGSFSDAAGTTLNLSGGAISASRAAFNNATLLVNNGGTLTANALYFGGVSSVVGTGTLIVDGANSSVTASQYGSFSEFGFPGGNTGVATFSNSAVGTIGFLQLGSSGGHGSLNIVSGAVLNNNANLTLSDETGAGGLATLTIAGGTLNSSGNFQIATGALVNYASGGLHLGSVSMTGSSKIALTTGGDKVVTANSLTMSGTSLIDLNDNDMIVGGATPLATVAGYVKTARNGGNWIGTPGITSTSARNNAVHSTGLGVISGTEYSSAGGNGTFDGLSYLATDSLVKYTYYGDADFNGKINANDYGQIDSGYQNQKTAGFVFDWFHGDFDYSGTIDANDYALIDGSYQLQSGTLRDAIDYLETGVVPGGTISESLQEVINHENEFGTAYTNDFIFANVPEPTNLGIFAAVGLACFARRHRRRLI